MTRPTESSMFDQRIADWLEDDPTEAPRQVLETVLAAMPQISQRRGLVPRFGVSLASLPRFRLAAAALVAIASLLLVVMGLTIIGRPEASPTPAPSPSARVLLSPAAAATATPAPGEPLPEALIGAWHHAAPGWWWFLRAGDPECVQALRTDLDCVVWQRGITPREIGIASMSGGDLSVSWRSGFCTRITSTYSVSLAGDSLNLVDIGGGCEGGNYALTRAGTGTAPTAPPPPAP